MSDDPIIDFESGYEPAAKQWHGPPLKAGALQQFLGHWLVEQLRSQPADNIVQINYESDYAMSAGELLAKSLRVGEQLVAQLGLGWGDRVCVASDHHDDLYALVIGALLRGVVLNPLHTGFTMLEFKHFIELVQPKVVFCEARNVPSFREALKALGLEVRIVSMEDDPAVEASGASVDLNLRDLVRGWETISTKECPPPQGDPSVELAMICCSSGTTGLPKGIRNTHSMLLHGMSNAWRCHRRQSVLNTSALYWSTSMLGLCNLRYGCRRIFTTRPSPIPVELLLEMLEQRRISAVFTSSPMVIAIVAALRENPALRLPHLRQIQAGGSAIPDHVFGSLAQLLPSVRLNAVYGMSDVGGVLSICGRDYFDAEGRELPNLPASMPGSSGRVAHGTTIRVIDDEGQRCGPEQLGELYVRKVFPFPGYLNNEAGNRKAFDAEGFLRTGDVGRIDGSGNVFLVDRRQDFFKYSCYQITPSELEHFIEERFAGQVITAVVVGVAEEAVTCVPVAVVLRRSGGKEVRAEEIARAVEESFSDAKRLRGGVYFVDELPRTASNKVRRNVVQQMAERFYRERLQGE